MSPRDPTMQEGGGIADTSPRGDRSAESAPDGDHAARTEPDGDHAVETSRNGDEAIAAETPPPSGRRRSRAPAVLLVAAAAAVAALIGIGVLGVRVVDEAVSLRSAPHDNVQWTLSQNEVDALRLSGAAGRARHGEIGPGPVRTAFDVLYSRVATVREGSAFAELRRDREVRDRLAFIAQGLDRLIPLIDGPDADLLAALPQVEAAARALHLEARALSLVAVERFSVTSDRRRESFQTMLVQIALLAGALILLLAGTLAVLLRLIAVSRRRRAQVKRERARLAAMVEASLDAILVIDHEGVVLGYNSAAERMFGHPRDAAIGREMADLIMPPGERAAHRAGMARHLATGRRRVIDGGRLRLEAMRSDGALFPVELSVGAARGEAGPIFIGFLRDISAMVEAEQALTRARDEAMAADHAKSEFIALMSHEMRTPLNGVLGLLDLLQGTRLDRRQGEYVATARRSGEVLLHHVNDVLDISRLEAGVSIAPAPFDLAALVHEVRDLNQAAARTSGNRLVIDMAEPTRPLLGDVNRLRQVLINLVGNAMKFTRDGVVTIEARSLGGDEEGAELELAVSDTGPGIARADQARIFEDFVTLDASYARRTSGAGLGLAICRRIAEAMGGEMGVRSEPGAGSRFHLRVRLPFAGEGQGEAVSEPQADAPPPRRALDVLMVEDNDINRFVLREMLEREGHRVSEAHDGRQGVVAAAKSRFDLILMDVSMPVMTGPEAARAIRGAEGLNRETPILAVTAHAGDAERRGFSEAGMNGSLVKPVRLAALEAAIARVLGGGEAQDRAEADGTSAAARPSEASRGEADSDSRVPARSSSVAAACAIHACASAQSAGAQADPAGSDVADAKPNTFDAMPDVAADDMIDAPDKEDPDEDDLIDAEVISELADTLGEAGFRSTVSRLCREIETEAPAIAAQAASANDFDLVALAEKVHKLSGAAALCGAVALRRRLAAMEAEAKAGSAPGVTAAAGGLGQIAARTVSVLREFAGLPIEGPSSG